MQNSASFRSQRNLRAAAVGVRPGPADQPAALQTVHQPNRAVMPELKAFRKIANTGGFRLHRLDRQHQLMLLRFHSRAPGRLFAEMHKFANPVAKFGQGANLLLRDLHQ